MGVSRVAAMVALCMVALVAVSSNIGAGAAHLTPFFYDKSCPELFSIVKAEVKKAVKREKRLAASLVRLHFHDCFVNGCDGSLLLDNATGIVSEKVARANNNSARGFEVIDAIKGALEEACPQTVSCADILAIASRDSAVEAGLTHHYPVFFGRRDSLNASVEEAEKRLPAPNLTFSGLIDNFAFQGLDEKDLIALSGAHTIGRVRCDIVNLFLDDPDSNAEFKSKLRKACPQNNTDAASKVLQNLDLTTPNTFDNNYYKNLRRGEGILRSDQTLWSTRGPNMKIVNAFSQNQDLFFRQFAISTIKMGNIRPLTGDQGQIRKNCSKVHCLQQKFNVRSLVSLDMMPLHIRTHRSIQVNTVKLQRSYSIVCLQQPSSPHCIFRIGTEKINCLFIPHLATYNIILLPQRHGQCKIHQLSHAHRLCNLIGTV